MVRSISDCTLEALYVHQREGHLNPRFGEWASIFGDAKITTALSNYGNQQRQSSATSKSRLKPKEQTKRVVAIAVNHLNLGS